MLNSRPRWYAVSPIMVAPAFTALPISTKSGLTRPARLPLELTNTTSEGVYTPVLARSPQAAAYLAVLDPAIPRPMNLLALSLLAWSLARYGLEPDRATRCWVVPGSAFGLVMSLSLVRCSSVGSKPSHRESQSNSTAPLLNSRLSLYRRSTCCSVLSVSGMERICSSACLATLAKRRTLPGVFRRS